MKNTTIPPEPSSPPAREPMRISYRIKSIKTSNGAIVTSPSIKEAMAFPLGSGFCSCAAEALAKED